MNERQRIELRQIEARGRLRELAGVAEWTDEQRAESEALQTELRGLDDRLAALIAAGEEPPADDTTGDDGDAEARELRALEERFNVGAVHAAVIEQRAIDGPERELQQHLGIQPNQVPLAVLGLGEPEHRAVTPAPAQAAAAGLQTNQGEIIQPVAALGDAEFLSAYMPTVAPGTAVYPVLTALPTVSGPHVDSTDVAETTGSFGAVLLPPGRVQASYFYLRTDAARFPMMGDALAAALRLGLMEKIDAQTITQVVADVSQSAASAVDTAQTVPNRFGAGNVDGRYARRESDLRVLVGAATYGFWASLYQANGNDRSALARLRENIGDVQVSAHIPAVASNKQDTIVRLGARRDLVIPMWQGVTLIPDEITKADTGEIVITAVLLAAWKVVRAAGFARIESQHA